MFYLFLNGYSATTSQSSYLARKKKLKPKKTTDSDFQLAPLGDVGKQ